jgi:allophanate hydrolase
LQQQIEELEKHSATSTALFEQVPLYGIPFAVSFSSTAGCMLLKDIVTEDAKTVGLLKQAGAIVVGKTNLDQFATGLVGTRSPFGVAPNSFNSEYVSGGSSSGSASVVACGLVSFSLGTDTAFWSCNCRF